MLDDNSQSFALNNINNMNNMSMFNNNNINDPSLSMIIP